MSKVIMFRMGMFIVLVLFLSPAIACEIACEIEHKKIIQELSENDLNNLQRNGFVVINTLGKKHPRILISSEIIKNCNNRNVAQIYFHEKMFGNELEYKSCVSFDDAVGDIAYATYKAISRPGIWQDGLAHEVLNLVDDSLFPDWWLFINKEIKDGNINIFMFTKSSFEEPDVSVIENINSLLGHKKLDSYHTSIALFLLINGGEVFNDNDIREMLDGSKPVLVGDIDNDEIIRNSINLMISNENKIKYSDAIKLTARIFGYW